MLLLQIRGEGGHDRCRRQRYGDVVVFTGGPTALSFSSVSTDSYTLFHHLHPISWNNHKLMYINLRLMFCLYIWQKYWNVRKICTLTLMIKWNIEKLKSWYISTTYVWCKWLTYIEQNSSEISRKQFVITIN